MGLSGTRILRPRYEDVNFLQTQIAPRTSFCRTKSKVGNGHGGAQHTSASTSTSRPSRPTSTPAFWRS